MRHFTFAQCSSKRVPRGGLGLALVALLAFTGCHRCQVYPTALEADPSDANGNGVFEPGETVLVEPARHYSSLRGGTCTIGSPCPSGASVTTTASDFTGPAGAVYSIVDATANYGTIPLNGTRSCNSTGDCFVLSVSSPPTRPATHWDATFVESRAGASPEMDWIRPTSSMLPEAFCGVGVSPKTWTLHIGDSFTDVLRTHPFYSFVETIFHKGITVGCDVDKYCPDASITRAEMTVFLLKGKYGSAYTPPPCMGAFLDVPCPGGFAVDWIEQLTVVEGIDTGCDVGRFCPNDLVTRRAMAALLLKTVHGSAFLPKAATGIFQDVPAGDPDASWIEELYNEGITAGCQATPVRLYCPDSPNTRGQMAVFITRTFGLRLYGL